MVHVQKKSQIVPTLHFTHLGLRLCTRSMTFSLPPARVKKTRKEQVVVGGETPAVLIAKVVGNLWSIEPVARSMLRADELRKAARDFLPRLRMMTTSSTSTWIKLGLSCGNGVSFSGSVDKRSRFHVCYKLGMNKSKKRTARGKYRSARTVIDGVKINTVCWQDRVLIGFASTIGQGRECCVLCHQPDGPHTHTYGVQVELFQFR